MEFLFTRAAGHSEYRALDTRPSHDKANHFRALVNILEKLIPLFVEFGAPATGGPTEPVKMMSSEC
jgi:hypothetical protein